MIDTKYLISQVMKLANLVQLGLKKTLNKYKQCWDELIMLFGDDIERILCG